MGETKKRAPEISPAPAFCLFFARLGLLQQMGRKLLLAGDDGLEVPGGQHPRRDLDLDFALRCLDGDALEVHLEPAGLLWGAMRPRAGVRVAGPTPRLGMAPANVTHFCHNILTLPAVLVLF